MPEWLIGTVLKTVDRFRLSVGSNPTPSASMTKEKSPDRPSQPACCVMCSSASSRPRTCRRSPRLARPVRVDQGGHPGNGEDGPSLSGREGKSRNELLPSGEPVAHPLLTYTCETDFDLAAVVEAWPDLPEAIRAGILAMVKASQPT